MIIIAFFVLICWFRIQLYLYLFSTPRVLAEEQPERMPTRKQKTEHPIHSKGEVLFVAILALLTS